MIFIIIDHYRQKSHPRYFQNYKIRRKFEFPTDLKMTNSSIFEIFELKEEKPDPENNPKWAQLGFAKSGTKKR